MSRPEFLADHDLNEHVVDGVLRREPSVRFVRARQVGIQENTDDEVLAYAASEGLLLVSHDVNTMPAQAYRRVSEGQPMAGLFMVQQTEPVAAIIDNLVLIWSATAEEEWQGQVVFLPL